MMTKTLFIAGALALSGLSVASAKDTSFKTYDIQISSTEKAGNVQLSAGEYKLKIEGGNAVFTDTQTKKSFTAPVKIQNESRKFDTTAVETGMQAGSSHIRSIDLGGTTTKLEFSE